MPRADHARPLPEDVKAFIERGASVMVGSARLGARALNSSAPGAAHQSSIERGASCVCVAMAASAKPSAICRDNGRLAVTFALPADSHAIQLWGRCIGTGPPHRDDLTAVRQHRDVFAR